MLLVIVLSRGVLKSRNLCSLHCVPGRVKGRRTSPLTNYFRSVGRCAIFGFVFLGQKNHKMRIAHLDRFGSVGRCAIFGFVFLGQKNHKRLGTGFPVASSVTPGVPSADWAPKGLVGRVLPQGSRI